MMKTFTFYELVKQLNGGAIIPVGETRYDEKAYERMVEIEGLAMNLIEDISEIAETKNKEASIEKARVMNE